MTRRVVIDTNVIISAALSDAGNPAKILRMVDAHRLQVYYSLDILSEYADVLSRGKFNFSPEKQAEFLDRVQDLGVLISPVTSTIPLPDETDRIFYDAAKAAEAILITGNTKHYPAKPFIMTPAAFLASVKMHL